jgi:molecular chaperone IbpA
MAGGLTQTVAQWRTIPCVLTILPRFIVPPSASTGSFPCSIRQRQTAARATRPIISSGTGDNSYRISVAVSGFSPGELSIVAKENTLTIKGEKSANENGSGKSEVLYCGIAARAFERAFQLADFVLVKNASLENGLLHVDLVREIPEAKKPRNIPITTTAGATAPQVVDGSADKAAA